jgi:hypothetical protein
MNSKGSSETTREAPLFNESSFSQNTEFTFQNYIFPQHFSCLDTSFLEWFVGFSEGNANFFLKEEGAQKRLVFEIAQKAGCSGTQGADAETPALLCLSSNSVP